MTRVVPKLLLAAALIVLVLPSGAGASPNQALIDCEDGQLDKTYSNKDLRDALDRISSDRDEYTDCRPVLNAAIASGAGKAGGGGGNPGAGNGGGGAGNSGALSGEEQAARQTDAQALAAIASDAEGGPIDVGGKEVEPGENGVFDLASAENGMPTPLILLLAALAAVALGGLMLVARRRLPALSRVSFPSKRISLPRGLPRLRRR